MLKYSKVWTSSHKSSVHNIPVKEKNCYPGVLITKDQKERCNLNYHPLVDKTQKRFNVWLQKDLSLRGRVLLTKTLSRLIYVAQSVHLDPKLGQSVDQLLFNFLWKRSIHYIRESVEGSQMLFYVWCGFTSWLRGVGQGKGAWDRFLTIWAWDSCAFCQWVRQLCPGQTWIR